MIQYSKYNTTKDIDTSRLFPEPFILYGFYLLVVLFFTSCVNTKKIPYFSDIPVLSSDLMLQLPQYKSPLIKKDDLISISIITIDPDVTRLLNQGNYLVDNNGEIDLPIIDKVKISDLTIDEARDLIKNKALVQFKAASVDVRFANFNVTILGEVNKPSSFIVPNNRFTILEAIGLAGDLTIYGKRQNVLLIIQFDNSDSNQIAVRLNLNSRSLLSSPYFYLKPRDVIYVEPNKSKVLNTDLMQAKYITLATSFISLMIVLLSRTL